MPPAPNASATKAITKKMIAYLSMTQLSASLRP
jgi:hypothetical protein